MLGNRIATFVCAGAIVMMLSSSSFAGPCALEISRAQDRINSYLAFIAEAGGGARESVRATMHRQPTPATIAAAESALGELDRSRYETIATAIRQARDFDQRDDDVDCRKAIQNLDRAIAGNPLCGRSLCQ